MRNDYSVFGTRKNIDFIIYYKSINYKTAEVDSLAVFGYSPNLGLSLEEEELLGLFIIFVEILGNEKVHYSILVDTHRFHGVCHDHHACPFYDRPAYRI